MSTFQTNFIHTAPINPNTIRRGNRVTTLFDVAGFAVERPHKVSIVQAAPELVEIDSSVTITTVVMGVAGQIIDVITDVVPHHVLTEYDDATWDTVLYAAVLESQSHLASDLLAEYLQSKAEHFGIAFEHYVGDNRDPEYQDDIRVGLRTLITEIMDRTLREAFAEADPNHG